MVGSKHNKYDKRYGSLQRDVGFISKIIHRIRTKAILQSLAPKKGERILDIGCNQGELVREISRHSKNCYGIDINKDMVRAAKDKKITWMDATRLKFRDESFDKAYSSHVLEHIPDLRKVFSEAARVLCPGGIFVVMFPLEVIRGQRAWKDSIMLGKGFSYARKLHIHKLSPGKIKKIITGLPFKVTSTRLILGPMPDYVMVLEKKR